LPVLSGAPGGEVLIEGPDGSLRREQADAEGRLSGVPAPRVGLYRVSSGPAEEREIGASLLSSQETTLIQVPEIRFRETAVGASVTRLKTDRPLWFPLACLGFVALLGEWWYFHRRPGG
ncbi:MAG: hypothetical protein V1918_03310, partial [Planctomycetota bacterium]